MVKHGKWDQNGWKIVVELLPASVGLTEDIK